MMIDKNNHAEGMVQKKRFDTQTLMFSKKLNSTKSGLDLDGFIREIGRRQKSFDLRQNFI